MSITMTVCHLAFVSLATINSDSIEHSSGTTGSKIIH